jgi:DNA-binding transcriptional MocR family regulator
LPGPARPDVSRALGRNTLFRRFTDGPSEAFDLVGAYLLDAGGLPASVLAGLEADLAVLSQGPGYEPLGYPPLRRAIAQYVTRRGLPTTPEQILVTSGAQQALHLTALLAIRPGDPVLVENPTYPGALDAFTAAGARLSSVGVGAQGTDVSALAAQLARQSFRLVYLIPTFHNPVGGVLPASGRRTVARLVQQHRTLLVDDQTLAALDFGTPPPPPIASFAPDASILTIESLSKLGWGGLRVGWIRAPEPLIAQLGRLKAVVDLGSAVPAQIVATRLLEQFDAVQAARRAVLVARRDAASALLARHLPTWTWEQPQGGLCFWIRLPSGDATEFAQVALRHGVSLVAGPVAAVDDSCGAYLRLPFGRQPTELAQGIARLATAWAAYTTVREPREQTLAVVV